MLLARIHVKPDCVDAYLELARATDAAVQASEPGMLHHTFDQDPDDPQAFVWSELYANDAAFAAHVSNPPVQEYLQKHAELGDGFDHDIAGRHRGDHQQRGFECIRPACADRAASAVCLRGRRATARAG